MRYWLGVAAAAVAVLWPTGGLASTPPVSFAVSVTGTTLAYGATSQTLSIKLTTGAMAETAGITIGVPAWPDRNVEGSPLGVSDERLTGAGRIISHGVPSGGAGFAGQSSCTRGGDSPAYPAISLPANSVTVLSYRISLAAPPWPHVPLAVKVYSDIPATAADPQHEIAVRYLGPQRFAAAGPRGVEMRLTAAAGTHRRKHAPYPIAAAGATVTIRGITDPPLRHRKIVVAARSTTRHTTSRIGIVTTDTAGRFGIAWTAGPRGIYTILARVPSAPPRLAADRACDLALTVN